MKQYIIMGIVFVILLFIFTVIMFPSRSKSNYSKELSDLINMDKVDGELIMIEYSNSGDMLGNTFEIIISKNNDNYRLEKRYSPQHDIEIEYTYKDISKKEWNNLENVIDEYNLPNWSKLKMSDLIVYDAATEEIILVYKTNNGQKSYIIFELMEMPDDAAKIYRDLVNQINSLA